MVFGDAPDFKDTDPSPFIPIFNPETRPTNFIPSFNEWLASNGERVIVSKINGNDTLFTMFEVPQGKIFFLTNVMFSQSNGISNNTAGVGLLGAGGSLDVTRLLLGGSTITGKQHDTAKYDFLLFREGEKIVAKSATSSHFWDCVLIGFTIDKNAIPILR